MGSHHSSAEFKVVGPEAVFVADLQKTLVPIREPAKAVEKALQVACEHAGWDFAQAWRADAEERQLEPLTFWMRAPRLKAYRDASVSAETKYGIGLLWGAFLNSRPVVCLDLASEPLFRRGKAAAGCGLKGGIFVPAMDGKEVVGVVEFLMVKPGPADPGRAAMATGVAKCVGELIARL